MDAAGDSQCLVCRVPINSTRFGMDACRACTSFLKRTTISGRKYTCRQGDGKCSTARDEKINCRGCRLDKCIAIGMEWDGPMRIRKKKATPILTRIKKELKSLNERRREKEVNIIKQHGGHERHSHPTEEIYYYHQETCMDIYRIFIEESREFFKNVFPAFSGIEERELDAIFKDHIGKMGMIEGLQRTLQLFGGVEKYQMYSVMTCYDVDCLPLTSSVENSKLLSSACKEYANDQLEVLLPIFKKNTFTEHEFYALMVLVMSEIDTTNDLSKEAEKILDNYRREALEDLQVHYQNDLGLSDFSARLGYLMGANYAVQECNALFKTFYRFYSTVFDVSATANIIKDFHILFNCMYIIRDSSKETSKC